MDLFMYYASDGWMKRKNSLCHFRHTGSRASYSYSRLMVPLKREGRKK
jgi:hypothetical protein